MKAGWTRVAFGEMATYVNDRIDDPASAGVDRYVGLEHLDSNSLTIRRWGSPTDVTATKLRFRKGDIIFGRRRVYQRKLVVADFDGICSAHAMVFRAKPPVVVPEFLPFFMQSELFMNRAKTISVGSLSPTINWKTLEKEEFALPPLAEQRRILTVLRAVNRNLDALRALVEVLQNLETSTFDAFVTDSEFSNIALDSLLTEPPRNGCSAIESSRPTGHWVLALNALGRSGYQPGQLKPVQKTTAMLAAVLEPGDLLISRSNTRELVGLAGTFDENRFDVSWPDTMMRLRPDKSMLQPRFLELFLRSTNGRCQIQSFAAGTSASMKKINGNSVRKIMVLAPKLAVQDTILQRTEVIRRTRESVIQRLSATIHHRSILLNEPLLGQSKSACCQ